MVGKYMELLDAYKSLIEAMTHAGHPEPHQGQPALYRLRAHRAAGHPSAQGRGCHPGARGFGLRGVEGKIATVQYARENKIPYLGICLGMQVAVIEFAVTCWAGKTPTPPNSTRPAATRWSALITEWQDPPAPPRSYRRLRTGRHHAPGAQECQLIGGTQCNDCYGQDVIVERHRHRYEVTTTSCRRLRPPA